MATAKITSIETHILKIPVKIRLSSGEVKETSHLITEIYTDGGVVGIGEGTPYALIGKSYTNIYNTYMLCRKVARKLVGKELSDAKDVLPQIQKSYMEKSFFDYGPFLALETAVIDAMSKLDNVPFARIVGGKYRERVPVCGTLFLDAPQIMAETARKWISKGVKHLKIKVTGKKETDQVNLKCVRDTVGYEPLIRIDANQAYETADTAIDAINSFDRYEVAIVEQPIKWNNLEGLRRLRERVASKIMVDESLIEPLDIKLISEKRAADIINFHPSKLGCLSITREAIEETVDRGLEYMIGSAVMTGLGVATHLQLAASMEKLYYPNEEIGLYEMFRRDIVTNPLIIINGHLKVPKNYGIGVKVDRKKLQKYNINISYPKALLMCIAYQIYSRTRKNLNV